MTRRDFERLPSRKWSEDIGQFRALVVLPAHISKLRMLVYSFLVWVSKHLPIGPAEEWEFIPGMHASGYRCMDFVAIDFDDSPICRLSGCSDVIHIEGIAGLGQNWSRKYGRVPETIPPTDWSIDCLPVSGLLRLFPKSAMVCGEAISSFEIYQVEHYEKAKAAQ